MVNLNKWKSKTINNMEKITVINPTSKVTHEITFKQPNHSNGKIVILLDGKSVGKINKASKAIFCDKPFIYAAVKSRVSSK